MKRIRRFLIIIIISILSINVDAASCSISANKKTINVGETTTVTVNVFAGTWNLAISGPSSEPIVGMDMNGNVSTTKNYSFTPTSSGTYTFKLTGDMTDYDTDVTTTGINKSVTITVNNAPVVQTTTPVPTTKKTTVPRTTKQGTIVVEPAPVEETTTTEMTTEVIAEAPKEDLVINSFKIVGYDLNFDSNNLEYTIDVYKDVNELYIIVDGENLNFINNGLVNIDNLSNIKVLVSNGIVQKEYTININRVGEKQTTSNRGLIVCIIVLSIFTLLISSVSLYYYVIRKK